MSEMQRCWQCSLCGALRPYEPHELATSGLTTNDVDAGVSVTIFPCDPCKAIVQQLIAEDAWAASAPIVMRDAIAAGMEPVAAVREHMRKLRRTKLGLVPDDA